MTTLNKQKNSAKKLTSNLKKSFGLQYLDFSEVEMPPSPLIFKINFNLLAGALWWKYFWGSTLNLRDKERKWHLLGVLISPPTSAHWGESLHGHNSLPSLPVLHHHSQVCLPAVLFWMSESLFWCILSFKTCKIDFKGNLIICSKFYFNRISPASIKLLSRYSVWRM